MDHQIFGIVRFCNLRAAGLIFALNAFGSSALSPVSSSCLLYGRTSREISDLEGELVSMRNLLNNQSTLVRSLAESGASKPTSGTAGAVTQEKGLPQHDKEPSQLERRAQALPDILDVLLAEKKVDQALLVLEEGDRLVTEGFQPTGHEGGMSTGTASELQVALSERRARLAEQLAEAIQQPFFRGSELRSAIAALDKLGDGTRAHTLLLHSHHERLQHNIRGLRPSGTSYGGAYTAALSQLVFSAIAQVHFLFQIGRSWMTHLLQIDELCSQCIL